MEFKEFGIKDFLLENLANMGYTEATEVQVNAIPEVIQKRDTVIESQTGSGKTAAFGIPLVHSVSIGVPAVQFLVLVPARELALQVQRELARLAENSGVNVVAVYGGSSMSTQVEALRNSPHIVVGTPGRILDHLKRRTMSVSVVRGLVLDEADKMLSMGFLPEMRRIFQHLPKRHQTVMSSATFPPAIEHLIQGYMTDPVRLQMESSSRAPEEIDHCYCITTLQEKDQVLLRFVEKEDPGLSLVFCNTKVEVRSVAHFLNGAGANAVYLSSDLSQGQRERNLNLFRQGLVQIMVCTDLAARGIDVPNLSHVFIYSTSDDLETYIHRTGRTGRAGKLGRALSLVGGTDIASFNQALKTHGIKATELQIPTDDEIIEARVVAEHRALEAIDYASDADIHEDYMQLAKRLTAEQATSLLPFLLEKFLRSQVVGDIGAVVAPLPERPSHEDRARTSERPNKRDRTERPRPNKEAAKKIYVGLGRKDGMTAGDLRSILKRAARMRRDEIQDVQLGDFESVLMVNANATKYVMKADGKYFRHHEIFMREA